MEQCTSDVWQGGVQSSAQGQDGDTSTQTLQVLENGASGKTKSQG